MRLRISLIGLLLILASVARAQFTYVIESSIPVEYNQVVLPLAWAGGLNSPQFSTMDLNNDAVDDLVIFDRTANVLLTFLNQNQAYHYAPEYEALFPPEINQWLLLRDFNCDGKKDIFTSDPFGMRAFVNTTRPGGALTWRKFNPDFPILTIGFSGSINLQVNGSDIPAIDDIDGDGDLDVLDARFVGIGSVEWHQNMSMENSGNCDSLQLQRITQTWGNFEECNCGKYIFGSGTCPPSGGRTEHAAGKSLLAIDMDNDGDRDLLFSEETCNNLYLLRNDGTPDSASIKTFTQFPSDANPTNLDIFPAAYYEDVDFDGVRDLVVAANISTRNSFSINFNQSVWLYKNTGTQTAPSFTFQKKNFLQDQMIDVGDNAVPAFFDADGDGDLDLFIGDYLGTNTPAGIYFFENTGTVDQPSFKYVTSDFGLLSFLGWYNVKPFFADMNADGKTDLGFTATLLQNGVTSLQYIANQASDRLDLSNQAITSAGFTINQPENVLLTDVNQDGKIDLLLGKTTGALEYWTNNGAPGTLLFSLTDPSYLGLTSSTDRQSLALAVADLDADGKEDLVTIDQRGRLSIYSEYRTNNSSIPLQNILYNPLQDDYLPTSLGGRAWPAIANLYNSDKPVIVAGNTLGGIQIMRNATSAILPDEPVISIYPNPIPRGEAFSIKADRNVSVHILSMLGQSISNEIFIPAHQPYPVQPEGLPSGMYVAHFSAAGKTYNRRFVIY